VESGDRNPGIKRFSFIQNAPDTARFPYYEPPANLPEVCAACFLFWHNQHPAIWHMTHNLLSELTFGLDGPDPNPLCSRVAGYGFC
jgi:hypothetical protein